ncbi:MAG: ABC transporter permease [Chloroflexota bacterium]
MFRFILRRLMMLPLLLAIASVLIFSLPYLIGVDPVKSIVRARIGERDISPEAVERFRVELGLDQPLPVQYFTWLGQLARGDLGFSYVSRTPVSEIIWRGFRISALLTGVTIGLAFLLAIPLGILAALYRDRWPDRLIVFLSQIGVVIPSYVLGPLLVLLFGLQWGLLPSAGWRGPSFVVLPVLTLLLRPLAYFLQVMRSSVLDVLNAEYIRTARAKGLRERTVIGVHVLRNSLIPVVTLAGVWLGSSIGGSVIVEVIFAIPGLGRIMYDASIAGDLPLMQAGLILFISIVVFVNTLTDFVYALLNPTIRLS